MWCFFDESTPDGGGVSVVIACLMRNETVRKLDQLIYRAKRAHLGPTAAKGLEHEIKGKTLLSNRSFEMVKKHGYSINQEVASDLLKGCKALPSEDTIFVFGAAVYGATNILMRVERKLAFPMVEVLRRVSAAAREMESDRTVNLVFDEQLADQKVSMSIRRFVSGVNLPNVSHYPLIGVSHVSPGIQLADLGAFILARRASGDGRFRTWLSRLRNFEWTGVIGGNNRMGIQRWDLKPDGTARVRQKWE